jgi:hypothetical protein
MQKPEVMSFEEQFKDATISFSPFVLSSTGIIQSQTSLKVDTYNLACAPYQLTMSRAVLLGSFTKDEIVFFQRYKSALAGLTLTLQQATAREPEKVFCRCQISAVGMMKGRDRVGLVVCEFKPIPPALAEILGEHLLRLERLKAEWSDYRGKAVQLSPDSSKKLGFNNYAVMTAGAEQQKLALFSIAVDRLEFLMPLRSSDVAIGTNASFNLFFQKYRFNVSGTIGSATRLPSGVQKVVASLEFSPELAEIMSAYFFAARHAQQQQQH